MGFFNYVGLEVKKTGLQRRREIRKIHREKLSSHHFQCYTLALLFQKTPLSPHKKCPHLIRLKKCKTFLFAVSKS